MLIGLHSAKAQIGEFRAWLSSAHRHLLRDFSSCLIFIFWHCEGVPLLTTMRDLQAGLHFAHGTRETFSCHDSNPRRWKSCFRAPLRSSSVVLRLIQQPLGSLSSQAVRRLLQVHLLTLLGTRNTSLCGPFKRDRSLQRSCPKPSVIVVPCYFQFSLVLIGERRRDPSHTDEVI